MAERKLLLLSLWLANIHAVLPLPQPQDVIILFRAVKDGDLDTLQGLLLEFPGGSNLASSTPSEVTANASGEVQQQVCAASSREEAGLLVLARDEDGWTALHWASRLGHVEAMDMLLDAGADVNSRLHRNGTTVSVLSL